MEAFIFNADLLCGPCGEAKREAISIEAVKAYAATKPLQDAEAFGWDAPAWLRKHPRTVAAALGFDPEDDIDSGKWPAGAYPNGGGESDSPAACGACGLFLENPLTEDGEKFLIEALISFTVYGDGNREVLQTWFDFYHVNAFHGGLDANTVADAILETIGTRLEFSAPDTDDGEVWDFASPKANAEGIAAPLEGN